MDQRLFYSATQRNSDSIAKVLSRFLPQNGSILEIASGSGEHAVKFQELFPGIRWYTSDPELSCRQSISSWIKYYGLNEKMPNPIDIDVEDTPWQITDELKLNIMAIICINMIHIAPWKSTKAFFKGSADFLRKD